MPRDLGNKINAAIANLRDLAVLLESLRPQETPKTPASDPIKRLVFKENWPAAVPLIALCDHDSDGDRLRRANMILDQTVERDLAGQRFLHLMCGEGEVAYAALDHGVEVSVGYEPERRTWSKYPSDPRLSFLTDEDLLGLFDTVMIFDSLDHCQDPQAVLRVARRCLAPGGLVYTRVHPWTSRAGMPDVRRLNKAFAHLFFEDHELACMGQDIAFYQKVWDYRIYTQNFRENGFRVRKERAERRPLESLFKTPLMVQRFNEVLGTREFPEDLLTICHIDYTLETSE